MYKLNIFIQFYNAKNVSIEGEMCFTSTDLNRKNEREERNKEQKKKKEQMK